MRFRRAFIALVASLRRAGRGHAQDARQVDIAYEITFAGISGFRIDVTARFNGIELRCRDQHLQGRHAEGRHHELLRPQPRLGRLHDPGRAADRGIALDQRRRQAAHLAGAVRRRGLPAGSHNPVWKPTPQQTISDADRKDSLDPLSAALSVGFAGDAACDKTVRSNDGKRRIDVLFRKIGMEPAAATGIPGAIGDVLVCEIYTKRVAGEFDEAPKEAETERERPIRIWLARFDNTQIRYPGKLEAQTLFATIRGQVLSFRERPLTPEEAQAIRR